MSILLFPTEHNNIMLYTFPQDYLTDVKASIKDEILLSYDIVNSSLKYFCFEINDDIVSNISRRISNMLAIKIRVIDISSYFEIIVYDKDDTDIQHKELLSYIGYDSDIHLLLYLVLVLDSPADGGENIIHIDNNFKSSIYLPSSIDILFSRHALYEVSKIISGVKRIAVFKITAGFVLESDIIADINYLGWMHIYERELRNKFCYCHAKYINPYNEEYKQISILVNNLGKCMITAMHNNVRKIKRPTIFSSFEEFCIKVIFPYCDKIEISGINGNIYSFSNQDTETFIPNDPVLFEKLEQACTKREDKHYEIIGRSLLCSHKETVICVMKKFYFSLPDKERLIDKALELSIVPRSDWFNLPESQKRNVLSWWSYNKLFRTITADRLFEEEFDEFRYSESSGEDGI
ncbi:C4L/C10L-like protein [Turkeypox virus]|uniref:C4L/C10L-like protein n=1 Tax=Turkeypox virus TaxID=336486 RepID=A0A0M3ZCL2_9POXV|nr:C4L/C10L-like protein [Turkeypox virus]ALA62379.1 C4L/C10L-like protein [Turkeypox virus]